jgi:Pyruvate/2-oxoacid:ferredoxin oxidoreductase delta subunit
MCEFCTKHGEGQKWYQVMRNYSRELPDQQGRVKFMDNHMAHFEENVRKGAGLLDTLRNKPLVYHFIRRMAIRRQKARHWGQVVPIEDVEQIVDLVDSIVRLPCVCRSLTTGREVRYCFGIGANTGILGKYPDYSHSLEILEKEEAKKLLRSFDKQGMMHSIWTYKTPHIGSICNCDQDCVAYRTQVTANLLQVMFRAEYVALVNWELCNGCKKCLLNCQFGAIRYSNTMKRATIEMRQCYGCGVCRAVCNQEAIILKPRINFAKLPW